MAAVMQVEQLRRLLNEAIRGHCRLAWIAGGSLLTGRNFGEPRFIVDFAADRLAPADPAGEAPDWSLPEARASEASSTVAAVDNVDGVSVPSVRQTGNFAAVVDGKLVAASSQQSLLLSALQALERARPGTLEKLSNDKGRTKRPIARRPEQLYGNPKLAKYAKEIKGGWWVATNNSFPEVQKVIRRAAFHAGLEVDIRRLS